MKRNTVENAVSQEMAMVRTSANAAILGAAIVAGDRRMIGSMYSTDAELVTPESTLRGVVAIANALGSLGRAKSLVAFRRSSRVTRVVGSTVLDSGLYVALTKRPGADSVLERGRYSTWWRVQSGAQDWVITKDHLYRDTNGKRSGR
jgi:hypothetical protein